MCYYLGTLRTAIELARRASVHRSTVHHAFAPLQHHGVVYQTGDGTYALNDDSEQLNVFARELAHRIHRQIVEEQTDTYTILWESLGESLVQATVETADEHFIPADSDQLQRYDLPLLTCDRRCYPYSEAVSELSSEILHHHILVVGSGARTQSYCLPLFGHVSIDRGEFWAQATKHGADGVVDNLYTYLDANGAQQTSRLPEWEDFQGLAEEYEVTL